MKHENSSKHGAGNGHDNNVVVNGKKLALHDKHPSVREVLADADFTPPDDCVLVQVLNHGTRALRVDDKLDLSDKSLRDFWAFKTDRTYRFIIAEHEYDWGAATIEEPVLRSVAHVKDDEVIVVGRDDNERDLGPGDSVDLAQPATEHLRVENRLVEVFFRVNDTDKPYFLPRGVYKTEQLMEKFPMTPGYLLNLKTPDGRLVTLKPGQETRIHKGMHFYQQVPGGGSS